MHAGAANEDFDFGAQFVKKSRGFKGTLAAANDDYALVCEARKVLRFRSVRGELRGDLVKRRWTRSERRDAAGDNDARSDEVASILDRDPEFSAVGVDGGDFAQIHIGNGGTLEP
jgi:hypothetical protein